MGRAALITTTLVLAVALSSCAAGIGPPVSIDGTEPGRLLWAVDGDTIRVRVRSGQVADVRLLAIDTPEKYATRYGSPNECGSLAASSFLQRHRGSQVSLVRDPGQDDRDIYDRLLRYVLIDGTDLGAAEVKRGLAVPYAYENPARRHGRYRALAASAARAGRGTWGRPCNGDFHSSVPGTQRGD